LQVASCKKIESCKLQILKVASCRNLKVASCKLQKIESCKLQ